MRRAWRRTSPIGDWQGAYDDLKDVCEVAHLPRTEGVSTTSIKLSITKFSRAQRP